MKRLGGLYERIAGRDVLREAFRRARRGARASRECGHFERDLDANLHSLAREILSGEIQPGGFHRFIIHDPKERTITAPCFRDRVLHHALFLVCEPHFDRWLIHDTYACRRGKGRLAALERATDFAAKHGWFVKMDVRKYFDSIPHDKLLTALARKIKDRRLLELFGKIVRGHEAGPERGLPIGSLVSQHLANFYLNPVDRLVKESFRAPGYVRYMDDFAVWGDDRRFLRDLWRMIEEFLPSELGLVLKPGTHLNKTTHGMAFCGFRVFPGWRVLNRRSRRRLAKRLVELEALAADGSIPERLLQSCAQSVIAFAKEGKSWQFRRRALAKASTA